MRKAYDIVAERDGLWWAIEVTGGLPKNRVVFTQARRINEVDAVARDAIALLLEVAPDSFDVVIQHRLPIGLQEHLDMLGSRRFVYVPIFRKLVDVRDDSAFQIGLTRKIFLRRITGR